MSEKAKFVEYLITKLTDLGALNPTPKYKERVFDRINFEEDILDLRAKRKNAREYFLRNSNMLQLGGLAAKYLPPAEGDNHREVVSNQENELHLDSFEARAIKGTIDGIIDEQFNKEAISIEAIYEASNIGSGQDIEKLNTDFIKTTLDNAKNIPDIKELRTFWARMLAQGASGNNQFSFRTIAILKELSPKEISLFNDICQFNIENGFIDLSGQQVIAGFPYNELVKYGLDPKNVSTLQDARLIDEPSPFMLKNYVELPGGGLTTIFGKRYILKNPKKFSLLFMPFTEAGMQLASLSNTPPNKKYLNDFFALMKEKGVSLIPLGEGWDI